MNPQGWAKVKQGARYAGVSERTLRDWLKNGLKHSQLPTGSILIRYADIDVHLEKFAVTGKEVDSVVYEVFLTVELNTLGQM